MLFENKQNDDSLFAIVDNMGSDNCHRDRADVYTVVSESRIDTDNNRK